MLSPVNFLETSALGACGSLSLFPVGLLSERRALQSMQQGLDLGDKGSAPEGLAELAGKTCHPQPLPADPLVQAVGPAGCGI